MSVALQLMVDTAMDPVGARYGALGMLGENGRYLDRFIPANLSEQERADLAGVEFPRMRSTPVWGA